jgi:AP-3 complex subunit mu
MNFSNPRVMTDCAFHPCVRLVSSTDGTALISILYAFSLQKWNRDKVLSFIPPDGRFTLGEYRYLPPAAAATVAPDVSTSPSALAAAAKDVVPIPIALKPVIEFEENGGWYPLLRIYLALTCTIATFDITLTSRLTTRAMENLVATLYLGEDAGGIKCIAGRGSGGFARGLSSLESGASISIGASWAFDTKKRVCVSTCGMSQLIVNVRFYDGRSLPYPLPVAGL